MSEIAALQAADRERQLPAGLRAQAYSLFMDLPEEVEALPASEEPALLPPSVRTGAFATLMQAPRRRHRPMILRLVAASFALALPATAVIIAVSTRGPDTTPPSQIAIGPTVQGLGRQDWFHRLPAVNKPAASSTPVANKPPVTPSVGGVKHAVVTPQKVRTARPPRTRRPAPAPPQKDLVTTVLDQVHEITDLACEITSAVLPVCGAEQKSPPILGSSG